mmetsp:Transcript_1697/g.3735  ORF Transcript_1697/g.3735 Transcript_1697/m.3735 type:complete len:244 (+) Transcript_1697:1216-1947(+)
MPPSLHQSALPSVRTTTEHCGQESETCLALFLLLGLIAPHLEETLPRGCRIPLLVCRREQLRDVVRVALRMVLHLVLSLSEVGDERLLVLGPDFLHCSMHILPQCLVLGGPPLVQVLQLRLKGSRSRLQSCYRRTLLLLEGRLGVEGPREGEEPVVDLIKPPFRGLLGLALLQKTAVHSGHVPREGIQTLTHLLKSSRPFVIAVEPFHLSAKRVAQFLHTRPYLGRRLVDVAFALRGGILASL